MDLADWRQRRVVWFGLVVALTLVSPAAIKAESNSWEADLRDQMSYDYECDIDRLSELEMRLVEGIQSVFAKVHCKDNRIYAVTRTSDYDDFVVAPCDPTKGAC